MINSESEKGRAAFSQTVISHTSIAFLKQCAGYEAAKNGDLPAAGRVVKACVKQNKLDFLVAQYPNAVVVPVLSSNMLPLAYAMHIGLPVYSGVYYNGTEKRKTMGAMQRLLCKCIFEGKIKRNTAYILADDVVTQGGVMEGLKRFIISQGGIVVAATALALAFGSGILTPQREILCRLKRQFGDGLYRFLSAYRPDTGIEELTHSQARYLLHFSRIENAEKKAKRFAG
jgi:hypothetical protein